MTVGELKRYISDLDDEIESQARRRHRLPAGREDRPATRWDRADHDEQIFGLRSTVPDGDYDLLCAASDKGCWLIPWKAIRHLRSVCVVEGKKYAQFKM